MRRQFIRRSMAAKAAERVAEAEARTRRAAGVTAG
jgi:hypothetical protein